MSTKKLIGNTVFDIRPYSGVGPVDFGDSRESVRESIGGFTEAFDEHKLKHKRDIFHNYHIFSDYSLDYKLEAVEFIGSYEEDSVLDLSISGVNLFDLEENELIKYLTRIDEDAIRKKWGFLSLKLGVYFTLLMTRANETLSEIRSGTPIYVFCSELKVHALEMISD